MTASGERVALNQRPRWAQSGRSSSLAPRFAVGTLISGRPRTDPYVRDSRIRLPPWVFDGKPLIGPRVKDSGSWEPAVGDLRHPVPHKIGVLAASTQRPQPEVDDPVSERPECRVV